MKRLFLIVTLISASFCGISAQSLKTPTGKIEENPTAVLSYAKAVSEISDTYVKSLVYVDTVLMKAADNIRLLQKNAAGKPDLIDCSAMIIDKQTLVQYQSKIKSAPEFPEKNVLNENVSQGMTYYDKVVVSCNNVSDYFSKGLYRDDKEGGYKKYLGLLDSVFGNIRNVHVRWAKASMLSAEVQEKASTIILQKSKIGEFAIPMKDDLAALDEMFKMYSLEFVDLNSVISVSNTLQNSIDRNRMPIGKDLNKLSDPSYKDVYDAFYNDLQTSLSSLRVALEKKSAISSDMLIVDMMNPEAEHEKKSSGPQINVDGMGEDYATAREAYHSAVEKFDHFVKQ